MLIDGPWCDHLTPITGIDSDVLGRHILRSRLQRTGGRRDARTGETAHGVTEDTTTVAHDAPLPRIPGCLRGYAVAIDGDVRAAVFVAIEGRAPRAATARSRSDVAATETIDGDGSLLRMVLFVEADWRRQGIAKALVLRVLADAQLAGAAHVVLEGLEVDSGLLKLARLFCADVVVAHDSYEAWFEVAAKSPPPADHARSIASRRRRTVG